MNSWLIRMHKKKYTYPIVDAESSGSIPNIWYDIEKALMDNCKQTSFLPDFRSCCFNVGSFVGRVVKLVCPHCILQTLCIPSSLKHYTVTYMLICLISNFTTFLELSESVLTDLVIIVIGIDPSKVGVVYLTLIFFVVALLWKIV